MTEAKTIDPGYNSEFAGRPNYLAYQYGRPLLDPDYTPFLQEFKLGDEGVKIWGSLPLMATRSYLLKQLLEGRTETGQSVGKKLDPNDKSPISLIKGQIKDMSFELLSIWLWLNGIVQEESRTYTVFDDEEEEEDEVDVTAIVAPGFSNGQPESLLYWINYFDIRNPTLLGEWVELVISKIRDGEYRSSNIVGAGKKSKIEPDVVLKLQDILNKSQKLPGISEKAKHRIKTRITSYLKKNTWNEADSKELATLIEEEKTEEQVFQKGMEEDAREIESGGRQGEVVRDPSGKVISVLMQPVGMLATTDIPPLS